jgi:type II secretory pathway pseudopilin PulG
MIAQLIKYAAANNMNRGFTLIEFIIYIAIVGGILIVTFNFGGEIIYGNVKSQAMREVQQNSRLAIEKITEAILEASDINNPVSGNSDATLSLVMQDLHLSPTIFEITDGKLMVTQRKNGPHELTNNRVKVTKLQFTNISYANTPGTIRVQMTIEHVNPNNLSQYEASLETEDTISLRK